MDTLSPNQNKILLRKVAGVDYQRLPIKTHVITDKDKIDQVVDKYVRPHLKKDDLILISERAVAITQGRAFPIKDIKPSKMANFLVKYVHKSPYGIGLGSPWTMELAIREVGLIRILFAAFVSAITKLFGIKGIFYIIAGRKIAAIDGPCSYTLPPYNEYAKLAPKNPDKVAKDLKNKFHHNFVIIDANDLGVAVLGKSERKISTSFLKEVMKDNPLGQTNEQTPICIVRKI